MDDMTLWHRQKVGKYNFLIYRIDSRVYALYVKQNAEMRRFLRWGCGYVPSKARFVREASDFIWKQCPGSRLGKIKAIIGDELRYTCHAYPTGAELRVKSSQTAVRELQKLVPLDMKEQIDQQVQHLYCRSAVKVASVLYNEDGSSSYVLEWPDGFSAESDFDFVDTMFKQAKTARPRKKDLAWLEKEAVPYKNSVRKKKKVVAGKRSKKSKQKTKKSKARR